MLLVRVERSRSGKRRRLIGSHVDMQERSWNRDTETMIGCVSFCVTRLVPFVRHITRPCLHFAHTRARTHTLWHVITTLQLSGSFLSFSFSHHTHTHLCTHTPPLSVSVCLSPCLSLCLCLSVLSCHTNAHTRTHARTYHRHNDINVLAVDVGEEGQHFVQDHHLVQTVQQFVDARQRVQSNLEQEHPPVLRRAPWWLFRVSVRVLAFVDMTMYVCLSIQNAEVSRVVKLLASAVVLFSLC